MYSGDFADSGYANSGYSGYANSGYANSGYSGYSGYANSGISCGWRVCVFGCAMPVGVCESWWIVRFFWGHVV